MRGGGALSLPARRSELLLAALVLATVGMMIVPLPTFVIDLAIALNLLLGVLLLGTALYLRDALAFAAFPTLLLLTTLYRLALNVSSTRLVLLQADAGRVIEAFGSFVVRGDYMVGALVFVVLTLVQFIVIARGAERVAEVSARFSLDAMPGKQMAIDSDLRAGNLSAEAARSQRKRLEHESQLYGALDGAMKFVKGDAIAGIVITLVNVVGGVSLGVFARGLPITDSLKVYGLLTIGDGLVTQIPALLAATSAGLLVTRVASSERGSSLAADIGRQLFTDTRVLGLAFALLVIMALLPAMPALPFLLAAALCAALLVRARLRPEPPTSELMGQASQATPEPLLLLLGEQLAARMLPSGQLSARLEQALHGAGEALQRELGLRMPSPRVRRDAQLGPSGFRLVWRELPGPVHNAEGEPESALAQQLLTLARAHAEDLVGLEDVQRMLEALEREQPALVRLTVPRIIALPVLAQVLRALVREGVSVRWLSEILEALAAHAGQESDAVRLTERVRRALSRRISGALAPDGSLPALRLSPELEEAIGDAVKQDGEREWLALPPSLAAEIVDSVRAACTAQGTPQVLLTQSPLRRHVRTLLQDSLPQLRVVCPEELAPSVVVVPKATVGP